MYIIVFIYKKQPHHLFSYIKLDFYTWAQNHLLRAYPPHLKYSGSGFGRAWSGQGVHFGQQRICHAGLPASPCCLLLHVSIGFKVRRARNS